MSFEEYMKSDEGKFQIDQFQKRKKIVNRVALIFLVVLFFVMIAEPVTDLVSEFAPDTVKRVMPFVTIGISLLAFLVIFLVGRFCSNQNVRSANLINKAVMLFWRENPVPWEKFYQAQEMILDIESVFCEEKGKRKILRKLILSSNGYTHTVDMECWNGMLDGWVSTFLLASMIGFLEHRSERGESILTLRMYNKRKGRRINGKKDAVYISKGKMLPGAKGEFKIAKTISGAENC